MLRIGHLGIVDEQARKLLDLRDHDSSSAYGSTNTHLNEPAARSPAVAPISRSFGDIIAAANLVMKFVQVLYYSQQVSRGGEDYQVAMTELVSLPHELILISDSLQLDTVAGLGVVIRQSAAAEIACCYAEMRRFLAKTEGVAAKGVAGVLNKVWWAASEAKELRSPRAAVSRHRAALGVLIDASNLFALPYIPRGIALNIMMQNYFDDDAG
ncbi:hypothetical protein DFH09DRAFT_1334493 [Mycena vulgaris]|nr:hypothetical protein DFH09DRAFT_1334493 [Mycena vulgaris]